MKKTCDGGKKEQTYVKKRYFLILKKYPIFHLLNICVNLCENSESQNLHLFAQWL